MFIKKLEEGLTVVELIIVIAIIGLIASVAIPSYQKYILNSKVSEGLVQLRKIYDDAVTLGSNPVEVVPSVVGSSQTFLSCTTQYPFGGFYTMVPRGISRNFLPNRTKAQTKIFFEGNSSPGNSFTTDDGGCYTRSRDSQKFVYGNLISDPTYFIYSNLPDQYLANHLASEGKNVEYQDENFTYKVSSIYAIADLDGDYIRPSGKSGGVPNRKASMQGQFYSNLTYLQRGIFFNLDNGEIEGTEGIIRQNVGE